ncbi:hypothetical protein BGP_3063 [Beggiatoa sp. PS]|nr:hypothetical protein BGP_3063 [Beggiatoa sp. PS]
MKVAALYDGKQLIGNMPIINYPIRVLVELPDEIVSPKERLSPSARLAAILGDIEMPVFINETEEYQTYLESKYL